jgi:hypothetical protein
MTCPEIDQLLGGSQGDLHQQLSGHIHAVGQPLGFEGLSVEAGQIPTGLQLTLRSATSSPKICDADVILAFWSGANYQTLVHELGHDQSKTMKELLDMATMQASSEDVIGAILV